MSTATDALQRAITHLDATQVAPERYAHRDDATHRYYIVTSAELEMLPGCLTEDPSQGYSAWCADTSSVEMPAWWTPEERVRCGWEHVDDEDVDWGDDTAAEADYRIDLEDEPSIYMRADLSQASAPLYAGYEDDDEPSGIRWDHTPYQTADARHDALTAAKLVAHYGDSESVVLSCVPARRITADLETGKEVPA